MGPSSPLLGSSRESWRSGLLLLHVQIAKRQAVVNPENTFFSVKRFIGRKMDEVKEESTQVPYKVRAGRAAVSSNIFRGRGVGVLVVFQALAINSFL